VENWLLTLFPLWILELLKPLFEKTKNKNWLFPDFTGTISAKIFGQNWQAKIKTGF